MSLLHVWPLVYLGLFVLSALVASWVSRRLAMNRRQSWEHLPAPVQDQSLGSSSKFQGRATMYAIPMIGSPQGEAEDYCSHNGTGQGHRCPFTPKSSTLPPGCPYLTPTKEKSSK